jgi:hypothetical protein
MPCKAIGLVIVFNDHCPIATFKINGMHPAIRNVGYLEDPASNERAFDEGVKWSTSFLVGRVFRAPKSTQCLRHVVLFFSKNPGRRGTCRPACHKVVGGLENNLFNNKYFSDVTEKYCAEDHDSARVGVLPFLLHFHGKLWGTPSSFAWRPQAESTQLSWIILENNSTISLPCSRSNTLLWTLRSGPEFLLQTCGSSPFSLECGMPNSTYSPSQDVIREPRGWVLAIAELMTCQIYIRLI